MALVEVLVERSIGVSPTDTYAEGACGAALLEDGVVVVHDGARPSCAKAAALPDVRPVSR